MQFWLDRAATPAETSADGVETATFFCPERGCAEFEQRALRFGGPSAERSDAASDEVLFVLAGHGVATIGGEPHDLEPGVAAYVRRGTAWRVDDAASLDVLSVVIHEPLAGDRSHALVSVEGERGGATAGREFRLLAVPEVGCASVTQFVGYIPVGRAPDHYHEYDEVVYVLDGSGELHIGGESRPLHSGACVHLPARLVHSLENLGPGQMSVLGVFRPAGSPAAAYYPDGTAAVVPTEED
ncbi:MAG TPA: cupin domain-containing protein [Gaiellaceae bacterium]|nr:cupin domain-containing protein [Gaiellaceae bacterium]